MAENIKIPLPQYLKILTSNNVPVPKAMDISGKIYKDFNTPAQLATLTDVKLTATGIDNKDDRKLVIAAMRKCGYITAASGRKKLTTTNPSSESLANEAAGPSQLSAVEMVTKPVKRKRKVAELEKNEFLPNGPVDEASEYGSLEFNEILDEEVLLSKSTVVNRAPLMTAWATVVAERMGFEREEALSIASVYTEMNALSKGVSLGIYKEGKQKGLDAVKGGTQPYVDLMGRRPLYRTQSDRWRALLNGTPAKPSVAFSYISRSFRQTTSQFVGALRLLANSFPPQELSQKAWALYTEFRPVAEGWGERSHIRCDTILGLRKPPEPISETEERGPTGTTRDQMNADVVKYEETSLSAAEDEPERKKLKSGMSLEEYEAILDQDSIFDDVDLIF